MRGRILLGARRWTANEEDALRDTKHISIPEIAKLFNRTEQAIRTRLRLMERRGATTKTNIQ